MRQFMRPAIANNESGKYSHSQLFNPADSGVRVIIDSIEVSGDAPFTLVGYGGGAFNNATFPESRGLALHQITGGANNYSKAHARVYTGPAIDAGMWGFYNGGIHEVGKGIILEPGVSAVIRGVNVNSQTNVNFIWHEELIENEV